jgi:putative membrane protein
MNKTSLLIGNWHFNYIAFAAIVLLLIFHFVTNKFRFTRKSSVFLTGISLLVIATFSPLDYLSKNEIFSAHMTQHIIALLLIPPLLLGGINENYLEQLSTKKGFVVLAGVIFHPAFAWLMGVGSMWVTHAPGLMMKMSGSQIVMDLQTISLLLFGFIFIWPVFTPVNLKKLDPLQSSVYLFLACVGCTALGILITFSPAGLYSTGMAGMEMGVNNTAMIRTELGLPQDIDQQIGGLIMWVPACLIYLSYVLITLYRWLTAQSSIEKTNPDPAK